MDSIWSSQPGRMYTISNDPDAMSAPSKEMPIDPVLLAWDNNQSIPYQTSVDQTLFESIPINQLATRPMPVLRSNTPQVPVFTTSPASQCLKNSNPYMEAVTPETQYHNEIESWDDNFVGTIMRIGVWFYYPGNQSQIPEYTDTVSTSVSPVDHESTLGYSVPSGSHPSTSSVYPGLAPIDTNTPFINANYSCDNPGATIGNHVLPSTSTNKLLTAGRDEGQDNLVSDADLTPMPASDNSKHLQQRLKKRTNRVTNLTARRTTCEECRKLHIKCIRKSPDGPCEKCLSKGIACVHKARAAYPARKKKMT